MANIYAELAKIQRELKAPKNLFNKFGQYYYRNAEGILEALKPLLGNMALIISDEPVLVGERFYIKATVTLTNGDESVSAVAYAREDETKKGMDGCQITGACSSYARKYALNALLMIDDSKDSDDDSLSPKNPENGPKNPENGPKKQEVQSANVRPQNAAQHASVSTVSRIPAPQAKEPEKAPEQPETPGSFIKRRMKEITPELIDGFNFVKARNALIAGGVIEDIPSAV
ncbi:MAG: ERF family protein, partial [Clostridia bacterium]|nr:ERF family protein [Clostridia bacterium]